ncbi:hypothetical protein C8R43DRAFT_947435 [Mycena crocata]|nr:hypothetical protein C8R43DRAFT_947435 [Mycena crocata]
MWDIPENFLRLRRAGTSHFYGPPRRRAHPCHHSHILWDVPLSLGHPPKKIFCVPLHAVVEAIENVSGDELNDDPGHTPSDFPIVFPKSGANITLAKKILARRSTGTPEKLRVSSRKTLSGHPTSTRKTRGNDKAVIGSHKAQRNGLKRHPVNLPYRRGPIWANQLPRVPLFCALPSCDDFVRRIPGVVAYHSSTKFCKKGRAICRIVKPYYESLTAIGKVFGSTHLPVMRAVNNIYGDNTKRDFKVAGKEFKLSPR